MTTPETSSPEDTTRALQPFGRREERAGRPSVVLERSFRAPIEDVWAAVTEPERLARWIGTWTGDPASGSVQFLMTAEGDDVAAESATILDCDPPRRLELQWASEAPGGWTWHVEIGLVEHDGSTTLTFAQHVPDRATGRDVGPGWEYYLDRLVAAESGGDASTVRWADYETMSGHYEELFDDLP